MHHCMHLGAHIVHMGGTVVDFYSHTLLVNLICGLIIFLLLLILLP
jgi:hypothetical protein